MSIFISVVSHGHGGILTELNSLPSLALENDVIVAVLDNLGEPRLKQWCIDNNIIYKLNKKPQGFGRNNNILFDFFKKAYGVVSGDFFVVLNPDVLISGVKLLELIRKVDVEGVKLAAINLYRDANFTVFDNSIRRYPNVFDFVRSYLFGKNPSIIDKKNISSSMEVDWAAGSFLLFDALHYEKLNGFDVGYYMYCEDLDICLRSDVCLGERLLFVCDIKAIHLAKHENRSIMSKHFYWHVSSICRYFFKRFYYKYIYKFL